ncbi:hypothetical protein HPP92_022645 [Vanilla planifolia]|uniref:Uncharacterized protein n=1 Tax=Vanilla planifolia TaxID=51239 RepID=A0A835PUH5_VANPL|nr:hypothetical protein HPP92_022645 [Vanilla planifolia]
MELGKLPADFPSLAASVSDPSADFPSLSAASASKSSRKKKPQPISLAEFSGGKSVSHGAASRSRPGDSLLSKGLTPEEVLLLPTGPRERTAEEIERSSRGFGYSSYGNSGGRRIDGSGARSSGDEARRNSLNRDLAPSRADEVDDWGSTKRSVAAPDRRERGVGLFDSHSRADEVDDWISKKTTASRFDGTRKIDGGGLDGLREKRGSFEMFSKERSPMSGADGETWGKKKEEVGRVDLDTWGRRREESGRADSNTWGRKEEVHSNGGGVGRPRLVLQPRSVPLDNGDGVANGGVLKEESVVLVGRAKVSNPFGAARPREEVLAEKGQDWKKLDEKLEPMKVMEGVPSGPSFGKKGTSFRNGISDDDCSERSLRKENTSAAAAPREQDEPATSPGN